LWKGLDMPPAAPDPRHDWWADAAKRPLGAYYRVDPRSVTDMHVALNESVLYASAVCHDGWDKGNGAGRREGRTWIIPREPAKPGDGGHAFVIVGYDRDGFLVLNSWGRGWGSGGLAVLTYEDWLDNAMDCWIVQLGVVTDQHREVSEAGTLRVHRAPRGRAAVALATDEALRNHELSPFVVDMGNNGQLSQSGDFRTNPADLAWLASHHFAAACERWGARGAKVDVALYAHGGLVGEKAASESAARWIPALYGARIFPVFFMWETDILSTLKNRVADLLLGEPRTTGTFRDTFLKFWDERLERLLAEPGSFFWDEMKQNAQAISARFDDGGEGGARLLFEEARKSPEFTPERVRLHLIGHSAGAIVHCHLARALAEVGWSVASVSFMAPACTTALFMETIGAGLARGTVGRYAQFHLSDDQEKSDPTCKPIFGYSRSLLYLVSESFEHGKRTPILGMDRYSRQSAAVRRLPNASFYPTPSVVTQSATHGGFDEDPSTMRSILALIQDKSLASAGDGAAGARGRTRAGKRGT
jgi:hypothetical protein